MRMPCQAAVPAATITAPPSAPDDERPAGCGWFDSSHELGAGLLLTVHDEPKDIAQLVPLNWWLQWELDECLRSVRMAPSATGGAAGRSR